MLSSFVFDFSFQFSVLLTRYAIFIESSGFDKEGRKERD